MNMCLDIAYDDVYDDISSTESRDLAQAVEANVSHYLYVFLLNYSGQ